jgi:hypothetical protein
MMGFGNTTCQVAMDDDILSVVTSDSNVVDPSVIFYGPFEESSSFYNKSI